jgi:hypothetical protein
MLFQLDRLPRLYQELLVMLAVAVAAITTKMILPRRC